MSKEPDPPSSGPSPDTPADCPTASCPESIVHARVKIKSVTFSGGKAIDNDTFGNFKTPHFLEGRAADPSKRKQLPAQFPYAVKRATKLSLTAVFEVTQQPTGAESVAVDGEVTLAGTTLKWAGSVSVSPSDTEVSLSTTTSDVALPDKIAKADPLTVEWKQTPVDVARMGAGSSASPLYVTLDTPKKSPLYWTLLDISCTAAAGETTEAGMRTKSYDAFQTRALKRKRDGHDLTYWNPRTTNAWDTKKLLAAADGSGQCGSWAESLVDMWQAHGDDSGHKVIISQDILKFSRNEYVPLFLVKNWTFDPPHPADPKTFSYAYTTKCHEKPGAPGQNSADPPPHFQNHFIVVSDGKLYDPSYGSPVFTNTLDWENASIDGLGTHSWADPSGLGGYRKSALTSTQLLQFVDIVTSAYL